jgi:hypothetical protein
MASPFQQQSRIRKGVYIGLILVLFTVSLLHRRFVVLAQANDLGLREETRGEVDVTEAAVRWSLAPSRGLAVCFLWWAARNKQAANEWNELELIVKSLAKLQPHFITPWLFQSWNLSFNVAVECDSPHDKYFYISEGILLLADGERRNRGGQSGDIKFAANPDLRFHLGFYYQLKIGQADENRTLQSLLQLSCIPPDERDPARLEYRDANGQRQVNLVEFEKFCKQHPRLVRRLREAFREDFDTPERVVDFLRDHRDIPSRYDEKTLRLKPPEQQFPILPSPFSYPFPQPDPEKPLGDDFDNYIASRAWYAYAQEPLPPPDRDFGAEGYQYDVRRNRLPRMTHYIFRQYPALAQAGSAERLAKEGWFDGKGWKIASRGVKPIWFLDPNGNEREIVVGDDARYSSGEAWKLAYQMFRAFGESTQLIMPDEKEGELKRRYDELKGQEQRFKVIVRTQDQRAAAEAREGYKAAQILDSVRHYRQITNFPEHYFQAEAERTPEAVAARKHFAEAERLWREADAPQALALYAKWLREWKKLLTRKAEYRQDKLLQEESYEGQLKYLIRYQRHFKPVLRDLFTDAACRYLVKTPLGVQPPVLLPLLLTRDQRDRIIPAKSVTGPFDEDIEKDIAFFDLDVIKDVRNKILYPGRVQVPAAGSEGPVPGRGGAQELPIPQRQRIQR